MPTLPKTPPPPPDAHALELLERFEALDFLHPADRAALAHARRRILEAQHLHSILTWTRDRLKTLALMIEDEFVESTLHAIAANLTEDHPLLRAARGADSDIEALREARTPGP